MSMRTLVKNNQSIFSLKGIFLLLLALLIFLPPLYRGLFFENEFLVFQIAVLITFILWLLINTKKKEYLLIRYRFEYALIAFVLLYLVVVPFAFSQRSALLEAFRYISYFAVYIMVRDMAYKDKKAVKAIIAIILSAITFVSIVGLLNYFGVLETRGAVVDNRLNSTLQYPNSLAALLGAAILLGTYSLIKAGRRERLFYTAMTCINTVAFILTYSRAMWLMLPLVFLVMLFLAKEEYRLSHILISVSILLPSIVVSGFVGPYLGVRSIIPWALLLGAAALSIITVHLIDRLEPDRILLTNRRLCMVVGLLMLVAIGSVVLLMSFTEPLVLANSGQKNISTSKWFNLYDLEGTGQYNLVLDIETNRPAEGNTWAGRVAVSSVDRSRTGSVLKYHHIYEAMDGEITVPFATEEDTYYTRVSFTNYYSGTSFAIRRASIEDAVTGEVVKELKLNYRFIPESAVQRISSINLKESSVQARLAFFKDALKIVKENPVIGIGGGGWEAAYPVYRSYEYWTTETHSYPFQIWIETGTLGLILALAFIVMLFYRAGKMLAGLEDDHPIFLGVLAFVTTILLHSLMDFDLSLGAVSIFLWAGFALMVFGLEEDAGYDKGRSLQKAIPVFVALVVLINSILFYSAMVIAIEAERAYLGKDYQTAYKYQQKAVRYNVFNTDYRLNLISTMVNNPDMEDNKKIDMAIEELEKAIKYDTYNWRLYIEMSKFLYSAGRFGDAIKHADEAIAYQPSIIEPYVFRQDLLYRTAAYYINKKDYDTAETILKSMMAAPRMITWKNRELVKPIEAKAEFYDYVYKANFLLDNLKTKDIFRISADVVMYENFYFDTDENGLPDLWQIPYQNDKIIDGHIAKEDGVEVFALRPDNTSFYIQRMNVGLEPSGRYLLAVDGYSKSDSGKLRIVIGSSSGKVEQFRDGYFAFDEKSGTYQTTFETTDDITRGDQYIRLFFADIEDEVVLKRIIIMKVN